MQENTSVDVAFILLNSVRPNLSLQRLSSDKNILFLIPRVVLLSDLY
jgi:hypothetical protein